MRVLNKGREPQLFDFTHGVDLDARLFRSEIQVQAAWARALYQAGVLQCEECDQLVTELNHIEQLMSKGEFDWREEDEDIHMNIERHLTSKLGDLGKKIHLGRSRNDLIATSLRLYVEECLGHIQLKVRSLLQSLITVAEGSIDVVIPGMTHLQNAQPIRLSQVLAAHGFSFARDVRRLDQASETAMAYMPLGSAALSGTTLEMDLQTLADQLGFEHLSWNSYDAVGDRDFMVEALDAFAFIAVHLSRLSEDVIYWASTPVGMMILPSEWSTGSSIMPNKRNPDVAELTRAKSAQIIGFANSGKVLLKGLPSSYSSDLHELKRVFIQSLDQLHPTLDAMIPFVAGLKPNTHQADAHLKKGHLLATEIANHLTAEGASFRDAYMKVAEWVAEADEEGVGVEEIARKSGLDLHFSSESAVEARNQVGGTSRAQVEKALARLREFM